MRMLGRITCETDKRLEGVSDYMITKKYLNGKVTIDAHNFQMVQEAIDSAVFNCAPVAAAVAKLREYEEREAAEA